MEQKANYIILKFIIALILNSCNIFQAISGEKVIDLKNKEFTQFTFTSTNNIDFKQNLTDSISKTYNWLPFSNLIDHGAENNNTLILKISLPEQKYKNPVLYFYYFLPQFDVFLNDSLIFSKTHDKETNEASIRDFSPAIIWLPNNYINKNVYIYVNFNQEQRPLNIYDIKFGSFYNIIEEIDKNVKHTFISFLPLILIIGILIFSGIFSIVFYLVNFRKRIFSFLYYGLFVIFSALISIHQPVFFTLLNIPLKYFHLLIVLPIVFANISFSLFIKVTFGAGWRNIINYTIEINIFLLIFILIYYFIFGKAPIIIIEVIVIPLSIIAIIAAVITIKQSVLYKNHKINMGFNISLVAFMFVVLIIIFSKHIHQQEAYFLAGVLVFNIGMLSLLYQNYTNSLKKISHLELESEKNKIRFLQLEQANILAQFESLKNQINPHFLFNCLNTLSALCYPVPEPKLAKQFIDEFSKIFRYILDIKEKIVIQLGNEVEFIKSYLYLQKIRFDNDLQINIDIDNDYNDKMIPPLTLQLLVENAIKHNIVSDSSALVIDIYIEAKSLIVRNNIQLRNSSETSTKIGHKNILDRYNLLTNQVPKFYVKNGYYYAVVPLLNDD